MSDRKARREIDKAIKHLIQYTGPNGEWEGLLEELKSEMFATPSRVLGWSIDELDDLINESPYQPMAFGFLFEEYATARWDDAPKSLAEAYLEHRGWREGTAGRAFLRALAESALRLWEVVEVTPGSHVDIRPYGTQEKPLRAYEQLGSESLRPWDVLAARLIKVNGKWGFTGGMLPLTPELAMRVQSTLDNVVEE
ncbi:MAG: hypothetical protein V2I45_10335, partial [Halieaceae bacterium]|nr:hypothetical protein [Halieaceae bacterium]